MSCNGCISPAQPANFGATPLMRTTESLPAWAIVVIVFGILLILILIVVLVCCLCRIGFWCCATADSDDERKKKVAGNGWFGSRRPETASSKRPQILYRYPDDDAATIGGDAIATSGSGYVPRALRLTNDRPKTVRVVEDVNFNDDGRPVFVVDGARSSVIGGGTLSSSRLSSSRPNLANEYDMYDLRGSAVDVGDARSSHAYGSNPHPAVITINGQGISSYGSDVTTHGSQGHGIQASHSASIQVVGGHGSPWMANPVPSVYPAL